MLAQVLGLVLRRLAAATLLLLGIVFLTFALSRLLPGDPARMFAGARATPEALAEVRDKLGLDAPILTQFRSYLAALLQGDLGLSIVTRRPVIEDVLSFLPATLELVMAAALIGIVTGTVLGTWAACRQERLPDHSARGFAVLGLSLPDFWMAILMQLVFFSALGWLPLGDRLNLDTLPPPRVTGLLLPDALLAGNLPLAGEVLRHLAMPALVLSLPMAGLLTRTTRAATIETLGKDFVRHARAKGLSRRRILLRHVMRNAMMPGVTVIGLQLGYMISGAVLVETVFNWPGVGRYAAQAIRAVDYNAIMAMTLILSCAYVLINLAVDLAYVWLDPRLRA